ncbi:MAG: hypothetical protein R6U32_03140 [Candidatus Woesearchaeota archaeon]
MIHHIRKLFDKVGNDDETLKWIREFSSHDGIFAVLKISGASLRDYSGTISEDLAMLSRLDLYSPVIYGWGDAFTKKLKENGIKSRNHNSGVRITRKEELPILEEIADEQGSLLEEELHNRGADSEILYNVFFASMKNLKGIKYEHRTGEVTEVDDERVNECINKGSFPLIPPLGYDDDSRLMNINADSAAKSLVMAMLPRKYIMVTDSGGIKDSAGNLIPEVSISRDYGTLTRGDEGECIVSGGMKLKLDETKNLIESVAPYRNLEVQIAHPSNLLQELFTDKGSGTYITQ